MSDQLKTSFETKKPLYERLATNVCEAINSFLSENNISALSVSYRIKSFESFSEKITRKGYRNPFEETEDICGIRVIVYFPDDVIKIDEIIRKEFNILESEIKADQLNDDQFGYRSNHFVVSINDSWLLTPNYRGLKELKAEIQVRTVLMHAWADLSHKLAYKEKGSTPPQFLRNIYQLSALFELADERFEHLRQQKGEHISSLIESASHHSTQRFLLDSELNVDTLQAYLDFRFPGRSVSDEGELANMIEEMNGCHISLDKLDGYYKTCEPHLEAMERITIPSSADYDEWAQLGMVRMMLDELDEEYMSFRDLDVNSDKHLKIMKLLGLA